MFSITFKRSAATLGVVAGLLAAAAPASAQILDGPLMWDTPQDALPLKAPTTPTANSFGLSFEHIDMNARTNAGPGLNAVGGNDTLRGDSYEGLLLPVDELDPSIRGAGAKAPRANSSEVAMESGTQLNDVEAIDFNALGTQVGSEGAKAPKPPALMAAAGTETGNPERKRSLNASGGWDPTHALNSQGIALHAVATPVVGGVVPGGAIVSA